MYKTYIDVVHIAKAEDAKLFTTATESDVSARSEPDIPTSNPHSHTGDLTDEQLAAKEEAFKVPQHRMHVLL